MILPHPLISIHIVNRNYDMPTQPLFDDMIEIKQKTAADPAFEKGGFLG